ncbi:MAG TPA: prepilin-type N-terminal cleavage/methylation domain-containing protein [Candidatus Sumerlaeota bacterium]|nr:prepilin-type N-terminal cleavage/methylation domain-containing protein [Candidatus Sumerlaeota bacterium]
MRNKGFTLIELLIVVAIIAILAAIAVPNFLEAQTRAKVSRTKADMRSIAVSLEAYYVDWNHYPFDRADDVAVPYYLNKGITTPIAYMTNAARQRDVFAFGQSHTLNEFRYRLRYRDFVDGWLSNNKMGFNISNTTPGMVKAREVHGGWMLISKGPDGRNTIPQSPLYADGANLNDWLWQIYDPTNGTKSKGEVMRNQKSGDVTTYGGDPTLNSVTY